LRDNSSSVRALNGLAASYDRLGRFDLARRYYQQALEISPQSAQTLNNMGYSLVLEARQKKGGATPSLTSEARSYFKRASLSDGRHPSIAGNLAMLEKSKPVSLTAPRELRKPLLAMTVPDRYGAWVERRNRERQLLVTSPSKSMVAHLRTSGTKPSIVANSSISRPPADGVATARVKGTPLAQIALAKRSASDSRTPEAQPVVPVTVLSRDMPLKRTAAPATQVPWRLVARTEKDATMGLETGRPDPHVAIVEAPDSVTAQGPKVARLSEKSLSVVTSPPRDLLASLGAGVARPTAPAEGWAKVKTEAPQPLLKLQDPRASRRDEMSAPVVSNAPRNLLADYAAVDVNPVVTATSQGTAQRQTSRAEWLPIQLASIRPLSVVAAPRDSGPTPSHMPSLPVIEVRQAALADLEAGESGTAAPMENLAAPTSILTAPTSILAEPMSILVEPTTVLAAPTTILAEPTSILAAPTAILAEPKAILSEPEAILVQPRTILATSAPIPLVAAPEAPTALVRTYALEVSNGTERSDMAQRFVRYLEEHGVTVSSVSTDKRYGAAASTLRYRGAFKAQAEALLRYLPIAFALVRDDALDGDIQLGLGNDLLYFDSKQAAVSRPN
jgi:hypothetical protein